MVAAAQIIDGKSIAAKLRQNLKSEVDQLKRHHHFQVGLGAVLDTANPASKVYVGMKEKGCHEVGITSKIIPASASTDQLCQTIDQLNQDPEIHAILVQLPLAASVDQEKVLAAVAPHKDADGLHPQNMGRLLLGNPLVEPCTPAGIMRLLQEIGLHLQGKEAVVVGRSNIVGKPMALLLNQQNATVTLCHSRTQDLAAHVRRADLVVAAVGKPQMLKGDWIKPGAVVIDVGINRMPDGKLVGDVDFNAAQAHASWITPVPGGVGPMTVAMLLNNTVKLAKLAQNL